MDDAIALDDAKDRDLAPFFFGDLSQSEKISEIQPPLLIYKAKKICIDFTVLLWFCDSISKKSQV